MFGVTRPRYQGRVEAGGSPQAAGPAKAEHKRGAPPAVSPQPERSPGLDSPHQRSRVMDKAPTFVGVDVAKHRLDVQLRPSGEHFTVSLDEAVRPPARPLPDEATRQLGALVARRRQLLEMLVAERNRRQAADPSLHEGIDAHLRWLGEALATIERDLDTATRESAVWRAR